MTYIRLACSTCGKPIGVYSDELWGKIETTRPPAHPDTLPGIAEVGLPGIFCSPKCWEGPR